MLTEEAADLGELVGHSDVKRLLVRLLLQDNSARSNRHFLVVHCPTYFANVVLVCQKVLVRVTVPDWHKGFGFPVRG
jgi:hypothetical protein